MLLSGPGMAKPTGSGYACTVDEQTRAWLDSAVGLPVWSAIAGSGQNYSLSLEIGERSRRPVRLSNPSLSFVKRTFEGSHSLVIDCPWRLVEGDRLVWSAFAAFDPRSGFGGELAALGGRTIEAVEVLGPIADLVLRLSGDLVLTAFALETRAKPPRSNWTYSCPAGTILVGPSCRVTATPRALLEREARRRLIAVSGDEETLPALRTRMEKKGKREAPAPPPPVPVNAPVPLRPAKPAPAKPAPAKPAPAKPAPAKPAKVKPKARAKKGTPAKKPKRR